MIALAPRRSHGLARIGWAIGSLILILCHVSAVPKDVFGAEVHQSFAAFSAKVEIDIEDGEVEVMATFTLGAPSNGLDPAKEMVTLQVTGGTGAFSLTIPAGSFTMDRSGRFAFQGAINRVKLQASIRQLRDRSFEFEVETEGANLKGMANPVTVSLTIGDDSGSRTVRAKIE